MSKQKILTIVGIALLIIMVIVAFGFKGKYDDASALLIAAQAEAADQKKAADTEIGELTKQLADAKAELELLQADTEAGKAAIDTLTAEKEAAEKLAAELEADGKEAAAALAAEAEALKAANEELAAAGAESEAALKEMTTQYNRAKADLDAKITRLNLVRASHAELAEKYDLLTAQSKADAEALAKAAEEKAEIEGKLKTLEAEIEKLTAEEAEYVVPERYESKCGISFVLPEGAKIGSESSKMVEILLTEDTSIKVNMSTGRINVLWFGAEIETVNQFVETIIIK